jgi:hypothetical protein
VIRLALCILLISSMEAFAEDRCESLSALANIDGKEYLKDINCSKGSCDLNVIIESETIPLGRVDDYVCIAKQKFDKFSVDFKVCGNEINNIRFTFFDKNKNMQTRISRDDTGRANADPQLCFPPELSQLDPVPEGWSEEVRYTKLSIIRLVTEPINEHYFKRLGRTNINGYGD